MKEDRGEEVRWEKQLKDGIRAAGWVLILGVWGVAYWVINRILGR